MTDMQKEIEDLELNSLRFVNHCGKLILMFEEVACTPNIHVSNDEEQRYNLPVLTTSVDELRDERTELFKAMGSTYNKCPLDNEVLRDRILGDISAVLVEVGEMDTLLDQLSSPDAPKSDCVAKALKTLLSGALT